MLLHGPRHLRVFSESDVLLPCADHPSISKECSLQYFDTLQNDPRFPPVLAELKAKGFVVNGSMSAPHWLSDSLIWFCDQNFNANLAVWMSVMVARTAVYKNKAFYEPARKINPDVVFADYDESAWSTEHCSLGLNGFWFSKCSRSLCVFLPQKRMHRRLQPREQH